MNNIEKLKNELNFLIKEIDPKLSQANRIFNLTNTLFNIIESQQKIIKEKGEE